MTRIIFLTVLMLIANVWGLTAQDISKNTIGKGIKVEAEDGSFSMKFSTRIQNLYTYERELSSGDQESNMLVRRARLKFDGHAFSDKLTYKIELGQTTRDIGLADGVSSNSASVVLDAVVKYNFYGNWSVWFGQTKLPGNIERVISSGSLQFVDRSRLNSRFNIDRDQGVQLRYKGDKFRYSGAITMGEGRNDINSNAGGYDFTNRIEFLPFGSFDEYKSSDHKRTETPKLMLAVTHDYNDNATRERGNLGSYMYLDETNGELMGMDLQTWFVDAHFKYNGWSVMSEYANKSAENDGVYTDATVTDYAYYTGSAFNFQAGYLMKSNWEVAGRYTQVNQSAGRELIKGLGDSDKRYTLGVSKYIVGHAIKVQSDVTYLQEVDSDKDALRFRFQVELGF